MLRNIALMRRDPPAFLAQCAERYGPIVSFPIPRAAVFYVADPASVRHVLQANHRSYGKRTVQYDALALVTGHGLLASDGELWRRMRRIQQPAFHRDLVLDMADRVGGPAERLAESLGGLPSGTRVDLDQQMLELTLEIVGSTLFGTDLAAEAASLVTAVMRALHIVVARAQQPVTPPPWLVTPSERRLRRAVAELDAAVSRLIAARRSQPSGADVLSLLLQAADAGEATNEEVRNEVVTLIVAGHETVAATLTWTWLLVAASSDVEDRVHDEVDRLPTGHWDHTVWEQLPYTRAVVAECLRLYPPAWVITRRSLAADELAGRHISEGSTLIMSPYLLHRDRDLWEAPDRFDPDRFVGSAREQVDRGSYLPFGAGPRQCIGKELALFEAPLVVAALARKLRFRPSDPQLVKKDFGVTLRPRHGLPATVVPR